MKAFVSLILAITLLFSLVSCASPEPASETAPATVTEEKKPEKEDNKKEEVETEEKEVVYDKADKPMQRSELDAIPIANSSMTTDQLRQICIDYIKLSVSFQWIPNRDMTLGDDKDTFRSFKEGKLEGGIPYINTASGNLYRIFEYYDSQTGILDCSFFGDNPLLFGTACSGTAGWAWSRVVNSAEISWTHSMNVAHGFIPVGPYKYDHSLTTIWKNNAEGGRDILYDLRDICKENGRQVMYESYALTLPADCYSSNGHVRMATEAPVVVRNEDGTIDGEKSYVMQAEQGLYNTGDHHKRTTSDGVEYRIRGNDGKAFTFKELFDDGYVPHTFAEFLGTDPVEKAEATIDYTGDTVSGAQLSQCTLTANYPISDVFTTVRKENGEQIVRYVKRISNHFTKNISLSKSSLPASYFANYASQGACTVEITAQLSNGEIVPVYSGALVA